MTTNQAISENFDIAIIGAGASGMACALFITQILEGVSGQKISVAIVEQNPRPGKKLLLTGNGRCNLTNQLLSTEYYHGRDKRFAENAISRFDNEASLSFFERIGLSTFYDESGKAFPNSLHASSVLDCMRFALEERGVILLTSTKIGSVSRLNSGFILHDRNGIAIKARYVVVACGGASSPFTGSDGNGYALLQSFGHTIVTPLPGIVQIKTEIDFAKPVSGIKIAGSVSLIIDNVVARIENGEILFTDYGLSGPPILQLSGLASRALFDSSKEKEGKQVDLSVDFMPGKSEREVEKLLIERKTAFSGRKLEQLLVGVFHNRLALRLIKSSINQPLSQPISELSDVELITLARKIKGTLIRVTGVMSLANAQVTIGGASTDEFDPRTMQSRRCEGLFACGEILDIDGDCGGYNLQWAWSSAYVAAQCIARFFEKQNE